MDSSNKMRSFIYLAVSAFAAFAAAQGTDNAFNVPPGGYDFTAGQPTNLEWTPSTSGTVTLKLQIGKDITPNSGEVIASNIPNSGTYSFVPPVTADPDTEYTVEIIDDNDPENFNFTPTFNVENPNFEETTSAAPTTTEAPTTSSTTEATTTSDSETSTTDASTTGTTMITSSASATESSTATDSESSTGTSTAEPTVQTTTAPGAGANLKVHGGMFALVAGVMAAL
ncbi:hypothetical protein FQN54_003301 [Arachnomyces sp. PD_36]|nr:hypothetical protein FQN54_003301 [Arachnomyces sp. PD_36]